MGLGHTQSHSQIYLLAVAHINLEFVAVDLPPFLRKKTLKNGVRAYKINAPLLIQQRGEYRVTTLFCICFATYALTGFKPCNITVTTGALLLIFQFKCIAPRPCSFTINPRFPPRPVLFVMIYKLLFFSSLCMYILFITSIKLYKNIINLSIDYL